MFYLDQEKRVRRPDFVEGCLRTALEYWGAKPTGAPKKAAAVARPRKGTTPYHDYRMLDPIVDAGLIVKFESWMTTRGLSGARKNHLRSTMSMMFKLAGQPEWRQKTRITSNPFAGIRRDRVRARARVLTLEEIRAVLAAAPFHVRIAIAVAVLAPKLRLETILTLRFDQHIDRAMTLITVVDHKAQDHAPPLVIPIGRSLRAVLLAAKAANTTKHVVEYYRDPVESIKTALRASVEAAGLVYGTRKKDGTRREDGVTFHTIRHSMATLLATLPGMSERMRAEVMGQTIATAQKYTHLAGSHQVAAHELLSDAAPVGDLLGVGAYLGGPGDLNPPNPAVIRRIPKRMHRPKRKPKPK